MCNFEVVRNQTILHTTLTQCFSNNVRKAVIGSSGVNTESLLACLTYMDTEPKFDSAWLLILPAERHLLC